MKQQRTIRISGIFLVLMIVAWIGESPAQDSPAHSTPIWFGTEVSIAPDPDAAGIWKCQATLEDLSSGEVLSAPTMFFPAGEEAGVQSGLSSEMIWELRVKVSADASEAKWSSQVTMGDQVMSISNGRVHLTAK